MGDVAAGIARLRSPIAGALLAVLVLLGLGSLTMAQSDAVLQAQRALTERGYHPGPTDGLMGPRTRRALRDFQLDMGLDATGLLDQATSEALARLPMTSDQGAALDAETGREATGHADVPLTTPQSDIEPDRLLTPLPLVEDERQEGRVPASVVVAPVSEPLEESDVTDEGRTSSQERITAASNQISRIYDESWWPWTILLIVSYGLFRLIRRTKRKVETGTTNNSTSFHHGPRTSSATPTRPITIRRKPRVSDSHHAPEKSVRPVRTTPVLAGERGRRKLERIAGLTAFRRGPEKSIPQTHTTPESAVRWVEPGSTSTVAGRKLGGMIYLGSESRWKRENDAAIDPGLPVAKNGTDYSGDGMPYWPSYRDINPRERATYLDWLAGGRSDKRIGPGYIFLYFYGLERRFFVDAPADEEKRVLVAETRRLLDLYHENHSVRRYLGTFLDAAHIVLEPADGTEPRFEKTSYELPLSLRTAIGRMAKQGQPLSAAWLLGWYLAHPETQIRTPATRAFPEFKALFALLFDDRYPQGLKIRTPKRILRARYTAASGGVRS